MAYKFQPAHFWQGRLSTEHILKDENSIEFYTFIQKRKGYVYAMSHPDRQGLLKIGRTSKNPFIRAKSMGTAGILGNFELHWVAEFVNSSWAEAEIHNSLFSLHEDKEFFRMSLLQAKEVFATFINKEQDLLKNLNRDSLLTDNYETWVSSLDTLALIDDS